MYVEKPEARESIRRRCAEINEFKHANGMETRQNHGPTPATLANWFYQRESKINYFTLQPT
jgi:hypothetical protein